MGTGTMNNVDVKRVELSGTNRKHLKDKITKLKNKQNKKSQSYIEAQINLRCFFNPELTW
jgi:hypothetical protein